MTDLHAHISDQNCSSFLFSLDSTEGLFKKNRSDVEKNQYSALAWPFDSCALYSVSCILQLDGMKYLQGLRSQCHSNAEADPSNCKSTHIATSHGGFRHLGSNISHASTEFRLGAKGALASSASTTRIRADNNVNMDGLVVETGLQWRLIGCLSGAPCYRLGIKGATHAID